MVDENEIFSSPDFEAAVEAAKSGTTQTTDTQTTDTQVTDDTTTTQTDDTTQATAQPANYAEYLASKTEGLIPDEDTLVKSLTKIKGYDDLETKLRDTEAKIPQFKNDESRAWFELLASGEENALVSYLAEKNKDYKTMSDLDIRRESLAKDHPEWDKSEVELEIRTTYGDDLEKIDLSKIDKEAEPDEYKEAVAHNKEVDRNLLLLSRDARDDRHKLIDAQSKIQLPTIKKEEPAAAPSAPTAEEIQQATEKWKARVKEQLPNLPNIKLTIDNKEVEYVQDDNDKKAWQEKMEPFNIFNYAKERGWVDDHGVSNPLKIAEDRQKIEDFDKLVASFATQVKSTTTKKVIATIKNIDGTNRAPEGQGAFDNLADAAHAAKDAAGWK